MFFLVHSLNIPFVFDLLFVMESVKSRIQRTRAKIGLEAKGVWDEKRLFTKKDTEEELSYSFIGQGTVV